MCLSLDIEDSVNEVTRSKGHIFVTTGARWVCLFTARDQCRGQEGQRVGK